MPGISHLAVYFVYKFSVASETKMRNAINQINFPSSCYYITYNNTFCLTMLKTLRSVHGQPPVLKHYLCPNATSQCFANVSGKSPVTKSKFLDVWSLSGSYSDIACLPFILKTTWNDNNMSSIYYHTNKVNHIVINRIFSVIYCSIGGRIVIFYFLPAASILVPR